MKRQNNFPYTTFHPPISDFNSPIPIIVNSIRASGTSLRFLCKHSDLQECCNFTPRTPKRQVVTIQIESHKTYKSDNIR